MPILCNALAWRYNRVTDFLGGFPITATIDWEEDGKGDEREMGAGM